MLLKEKKNRHLINITRLFTRLWYHFNLLRDLLKIITIFYFLGDWSQNKIAYYLSLRYVTTVILTSTKSENTKQTILEDNLQDEFRETLTTS